MESKAVNNTYKCSFSDLLTSSMKHVSKITLSTSMVILPLIVLSI